MSDERLRDLERQYSQAGDDQSLQALLAELVRLGPAPCPNCGRSIHDDTPVRLTCSWCGTVWNPNAAQSHLRAVEQRVAGDLNVSGTVTGRLSCSGGPNFSNLPSRSTRSAGEGVQPGARLVAGAGIRFTDSPDGVVISRLDPTEPAPALCSILICAEPAWRSPREAVIGVDLCLGHAIEESDREGIEVPRVLRQELRYQIRDRNENGWPEYFSPT
jgi:hypothetical protein